MNIEKSLYDSLIFDHEKILAAVTSNFSVQTFTGIYAPFGVESNWLNNRYNGALVVGDINGDIHFGAFENGTTGFVIYTQSGWQRFYIDRQIKSTTTLGASTIAALTSAVWSTNYGEYLTTTIGHGNEGQVYTNLGIHYLCIDNDGTTHRWIRLASMENSDNFTRLNAITIPDYTYFPTFSTFLVSNGSKITIPPKHKISSIIIETQDSLGGNFQIGDTALQEIVTMTVTGPVTTAGTIIITLDGVNYSVPLNVTGVINTDSIIIRLYQFPGYTPGGTSGTPFITFLSDKYRSEGDPSFNANGTGMTATITSTTQGIDANANIINTITLDSFANSIKQMIFNWPDSLLSTSSSKDIYVYISTASVVKLHVLFQKILA